MEREKILIIDDDRDLVEFMQIGLEANGYVVYHAGNGNDGLRQVKEIHPNLIILDVMMDTDTEGFQVSYKLRSQDPESEYQDCADIPILMLTGISQKMNMKFSPEDDQNYLPVDAFMEKPVRLETLLEKVKSLIKKE